MDVVVLIAATRGRAVALFFVLWRLVKILPGTQAHGKPPQPLFPTTHELGKLEILVPVLALGNVYYLAGLCYSWIMFIAVVDMKAEDVSSKYI